MILLLLFASSEAIKGIVYLLSNIWSISLTLDNPFFYNYFVRLVVLHFWDKGISETEKMVHSITKLFLFQPWRKINANTRTNKSSFIRPILICIRILALLARYVLHRYIVLLVSISMNIYCTLISGF